MTVKGFKGIYFEQDGSRSFHSSLSIVCYHPDTHDEHVLYHRSHLSLLIVALFARQCESLSSTIVI